MSTKGRSVQVIKSLVIPTVNTVGLNTPSICVPNPPYTFLMWADLIPGSSQLTLLEEESLSTFLLVGQQND